jgi:hypothetical protein
MSYTIVTDFAGQIGVTPRLIRIASTDSLATITTAGYLVNSSNNVYQILPTDFLFITYLNNGAVVNDMFTPSFSAGVITLNSFGISITTPTIANHLIVSTNTSGTLANLTGTAINAGSIQAGLSGTAGTLISFPGTAANGSLILAAVNAGGAFNTTISNGTMGQSTVYTMGDIGATTGGLVVATAALRMKSVAKAAVAGGNASQTVTDTFCATTSNVIANWSDTSNAVEIETVTAGNGSFIVVSTGDPGASHLNYVIIK